MTRPLAPTSLSTGFDRARVLCRAGAATALAVALVLVAGCDRSPLLVAPGAPAPAFTLPRLAGGTAEFPAEYRGRVVAIRFWADWCPYCGPEMTALEPIYGQLRERGLAYLAVNVMQPRAQVERFVREVGVSADVLLDGEGATTRAYGVMALPVTVLVDREGRVRSRIVGESTAATFASVVEPLLASGGERATAPAPQ
jgi:peroxiredoxin